jgi:hypothetical protein
MDIHQHTTRRMGGLTGGGPSAALLARIRDGWDDYTPSQRAEVAAILEQLAAALKREHSVCQRATAVAPAPAGGNGRVPLVGRLTA